MADVDFQSLQPVDRLLSRVRAELGASFAADRPLRLSRAPGRLDVMGGIADYTGSLVCEATLDCAAAVALQERQDRQVQIVSLNLLDLHEPFTLTIPLDALADRSSEELRREFAQPGRSWAGYLAGCLFILHEERLIDLRDPRVKGLNLALDSTVPIGAGVSSSAAVEVATMMNLVDHFGLRNGSLRSGGDPNGRQPGTMSDPARTIDAMKLASLCQSVENRIVGAPCGIMDQVTSCAGEAGQLLRLRCQPHELQPPLAIPPRMRLIGINSNVAHSVGGGQYGRTRCAAFMAHKMILEKIRQMGHAAGKTLERDPMSGYLANLDPSDYKRFFRPYLPEFMKGGEFLLRFGGTIDHATRIEPDVLYPVQHAADHHVLEARRVSEFARYFEEAARQPPNTRAAGSPLDRAGHLMYASHQSYTVDAMLGCEECDLLVDLVRKNEPSGLYGAKITGGGGGGTVAVLADISPRSDQAIGLIMGEYEKRTGRKPSLMAGSSPGAWQVGTVVFSSTPTA